MVTLSSTNIIPPQVREGLIRVLDPPVHARGNFLDSPVELDRRLLDYIVGLDSEINELVDGSDLYTPSVSLGDVALPPEHRQALRFHVSWGQNS